MKGHRLTLFFSAALLLAALTLSPLSVRMEDSHAEHTGVSQTQDPEKALENVRAEMKDIKRALARDGKYACCIAPSCDFCATSIGECPCNDNLTNGKPVCYECKGGWMAGHGVVEDVKPEEVKTPPKEMNTMMYDARAKKILKKK